MATWPKYTNYVADKRFQDIARILGLPATTPEEAVESYAKAVHDLAVRCGIKMSLREQGIDEQEFLDARRELALNAFEDQCTPANPRLAMVEDMEEIMTKAYYGK
ncbi:bifunctional acetaldehyde-CoA/alcohol dehydrogenase [Actinobacillus pleuropneumoniae]|nr:bifunctional acetaldehyde-CoA/alcohol dehydrogenase [Actinobacillus pleuropneumoniae]